MSSASDRTRGPVLAADEHVARPVVGPRVEDLARQRLVVGDGVRVHGLAEDQVAPALEQLADRGLALGVEPVDPELDAEPLGQGPGQLDVEARALVPGAGVGQVGGVHADDQLAAVADPAPGVGGAGAGGRVAVNGGRNGTPWSA